MARRRPRSQPPAVEDRRVIGYFTSWGICGRNFHVADIPADKLTL
jgi:GH18 family chitinase